MATTLRCVGPNEERRPLTEAERDVDCPACKEAAGLHCRTVYDTIPTAPHRTRTALARRKNPLNKD
jgi:hypothetical protein